MTNPTPGGFRKLDMTSRIELEPHKARADILDAYKRAGCSLRAAAGLLGATERTLHRWVDKLEMREDLEKMTATAQREGWLAKTRRPVKS
jgi:transposase